MNKEDVHFLEKANVQPRGLYQPALRASKYIIKLLAVSQIVKWFEPSIE